MLEYHPPHKAFKRVAFYTPLLGRARCIVSRSKMNLTSRHSGWFPIHKLVTLTNTYAHAKFAAFILRESPRSMHLIHRIEARQLGLFCQALAL